MNKKLDVNIQQSIIDDFNGTSLNPIWGCEYQCPPVANGYVRFNLKPNASPNQNVTWSKIYYKPNSLGYGTYSMRFRYNRRPPYPAEGELWAGLALWDNNAPDSMANEVNFGIDTACVQRCNDTTLLLESYKNGKNTEVVCQTGVNLFDGNWHTGILIYTSTKITLNVDGKDVGYITDTTTIPTVLMTFVPGARTINGKLISEFNLDIDNITISTGTSPNTKYKCSGAPAFICTEDSAGIYNTIEECQSACKAPIIKYKCSGAPNYICCIDQTGAYDTLEECQSVCKAPAPVTCSIKITVPIGGRTYRIRNSVMIRWTSTDNVGSTVKIELLKNSAIIKTIDYHTANDGSYYWTVPSVSRGSYYQIRITSLSNNACTGTSDKFTIR